ncbi:MAG: hypothetical protein HYZ28_25280 [Myxococcales bacterium]|nr:hypothetical protein [Myxococcales bacterium]
MRHFVRAVRAGFIRRTPSALAELGPGDSLGIGLAALLSGSERYIALDAVGYASLSRNLEVFDELVQLVSRRAPIPDEREFPRLKPNLDSYAFPSDVLSAGRLERSLAPERLAHLRRALASVVDGGGATGEIRYIAPWDRWKADPSQPVDMVLSQAVLEHADDLEAVYSAQASWLSPGGIVSHQIDFDCHGTAAAWNGHWAYSDITWTLLRGWRPYFINREPYSTHRACLVRQGLEIVEESLQRDDDGVDRALLASRFRQLSEADFTTRGVFLIARKKSPGSAP